MGRGGRLFSGRARGGGASVSSLLGRACVALGVRIFSNSMHDEAMKHEMKMDKFIRSTQHEPEVRPLFSAGWDS